MATDKPAYRVDTYANLRAIADSDHVIFCIPSLVSTLLRKERDKGSALTEEEATSIRNQSPAVLLKKGTEKAIIDGRGYDDIDPETVWPEWQKARQQLTEKPEGEQVTTGNAEKASPSSTESVARRP